MQTPVPIHMYKVLNEEDDLRLFWRSTHIPEDDDDVTTEQNIDDYNAVNTYVPIANDRCEELFEYSSF